MPGLREEIGELWREVNRGMHDRFRTAFRGDGMPFGALMLLRQIAQEPGVTVNELARRIGMAKSHVSKMLEHLVHQAFVEKRTDPDDQRLLRIFATPPAEAQMKEMEARVQVLWAEIMEQVPEEQLATVAEGLRILVTALKSANEKVSPDQGEAEGPETAGGGSR